MGESLSHIIKSDLLSSLDSPSRVINLVLSFSVLT